MTIQRGLVTAYVAVAVVALGAGGILRYLNLNQISASETTVTCPIVSGSKTSTSQATVLTDTEKATYGEDAKAYETKTTRDALFHVVISATEVSASGSGGKVKFTVELTSKNKIVDDREKIIIYSSADPNLSDSARQIVFSTSQLKTGQPVVGTKEINISNYATKITLFHTTGSSSNKRGCIPTAINLQEVLASTCPASGLALKVTPSAISGSSGSTVQVRLQATGFVASTEQVYAVSKGTLAIKKGDQDETTQYTLPSATGDVNFGTRGNAANGAKNCTVRTKVKVTVTGSTATATATGTATATSTASATATSTSGTTGETITVKNGWTAVAVPWGANYYASKAFTDLGMAVFAFNRTGNGKWIYTPASGVKYMRWNVGYYIYNPGPERTVNLTLGGAISEAYKYAPEARSGWNLLAISNSGKAYKLEEIPVNVIDAAGTTYCPGNTACVAKKTLKELLTGDNHRGYRTIYIIRDPHATTAEEAFQKITITDDNLDTATIPTSAALSNQSGYTDYWFYIFK